MNIETNGEAAAGRPAPAAPEQKYYWLSALSCEEVRCLKDALENRQHTLLLRSRRVLRRMAAVCTAPADAQVSALELSAYIEDANIISNLLLTLERYLLEEIPTEEPDKDA